MVSPFSSSISDVVRTLLPRPPNKLIPCGEAQALCHPLRLAKVWVFFQLTLPLIKVMHDFALSPEFPPQVTRPVCVCPSLGSGIGGMGQFQVPSMFSNSVESRIPPSPSPPVTNTNIGQSPQVFLQCFFMNFSCLVPAPHPWRFFNSAHTSARIKSFQVVYFLSTSCR